MKRRTFMKATALLGASPQTGAVLAQTNADSPLVALAGSDDPELANPAPLDAPLTTDQVRNVVRLALDRDTSPRNLRRIVTPDSWVVIKPNIVTAVNRDDFTAEGIDHWWLVTDLRVVRAVAEYLIEHVGPRRITIAEGPAWAGSGGKLDSREFIDGWHSTWEGFGGLSYAGIAGELDRMRAGTTVDWLDLNEDEGVYVEDFDPGGSGIGALQWVKPGDPDGSSDREWTRRKGIWLPRTIMERDVLITVPVLKTHSSAGVTLCFKNLVGCVHSTTYGDGVSKQKIHQGSQLGLLRGIADLGASIHPDYAVAEGFWATVQQHLGQNGVGIRHNVVVAGSDIVAAEAMCMMVMGYNPLDYDLLRWLHEKRLGEWHPGRIRIAGPPAETLSRNFPRAVNTYFARGVRQWRLRGPLRKASEAPDTLDPQTDAGQWTLFDGDLVLDSLVNSTPPSQLQECLLLPLPGSAGARSGSVWYLAVTASTARPDLIGQILVGGRGASVRAFFNGRTIEYPAAGMAYDPTPMPYLKFLAGDNTLVLEITKTARRTDPVLFAANLCDLDGDRLPDIVLTPEVV